MGVRDLRLGSGWRISLDVVFHRFHLVFGWHALGRLLMRCYDVSLLARQGVAWLANLLAGSSCDLDNNNKTI